MRTMANLFCARQATVERFSIIASCDGQTTIKIFCSLIMSLQIHCLYLVPPIITFLAKHPSVKNYDLTSIDTIISGAAPLGEELTHAVRENLPFVVALGQGKRSLEPLILLVKQGFYYISK